MYRLIVEFYLHSTGVYCRDDTRITGAHGMSRLLNLYRLKEVMGEILVVNTSVAMRGALVDFSFVKMMDEQIASFLDEKGEYADM